MSRYLRSWPLVAALALLVIACFHKALAGEQFDYRDAAHFYYPLYQRVQTEWNEGRWPLWEPEENAGIPLLGNPTAAVLYPGKIIYAALPYPAAARAYVIAHTLLAVAGAYLLARQLSLSRAAAGIAGLSYAFSAPIMFQYCNIIFLVGAAWTPFALRAADRWLREGKRSAILELAFALSMQVLGGDPQIAYMTGLCAGGYALMLTRDDRRDESAPAPHFLLKVALGLVVVAVWVALTVIAAQHLPTMRPPRRPNQPPGSFPWSAWVGAVVLGFWLVVGVKWMVDWSKGKTSARSLWPRLAGLGGAAVLSAMLTGAQLLPVVEFARLTGRSSGEGAHDFYPFSLAPTRIVEALFPNVYGTSNGGNHFWLGLLPPQVMHRIWVPSLYMGGLALVLALSALSFRRVPTWRRWLTLIAVLSLWASLGEYGGPLFWARRVPSLAASLGPPDPVDTNTVRMDGHLRDGDGSFYWALTIALPGFSTFRFPSKFLTLTMLSMSMLAGLGWDRLLGGRRRAALAWLALLGLPSLGVLAFVWLRSGWIRSRFVSYVGETAFGPFLPEGALGDIRWAVGQACLAMAGTLLIVILARRRPKLAEPLALLFLAADLSFANAPLILTAPQAEFDATPKYLEIIREAERKNPSPGPYRVHRMPIWNPYQWRVTPSDDRVRDFLRWERDTLQPKYGITHGVQYTYTLGTAELFDYEWFFGPFTQPVSEAIAAQIGKISTKERLVYYPRRGFDLWNTRYFILPEYTVWTDTDRGVVSLLTDTEKVYPPLTSFKGPGGGDRYEEFVRKEDVQIVRNLNALPRAWIVHEARFWNEITGLARSERKERMEEMIYAEDPFWNDPRRTLYDPRRIAWIEVPSSDPIRKALYQTRSSPSDYVKVVKQEPQRVELDVSMRETGLVILAETHYPGWKLTIDGQPAEILRANRVMRGALVKGSPQVQRLAYTYEPSSFLWGTRLSLLGLVAATLTGLWAVRTSRPTAPEEPAIA